MLAFNLVYNDRFNHVTKVDVNVSCARFCYSFPLTVDVTSRETAVSCFLLALQKHPIETVQPNSYLTVNCTSFGCTIKYYFLITPEFHRIFLWKVLHAAINIMDHFCMTTNFSKH